MTHPPLLSPEDIAQRCGLSRRAVYDTIRRGELPAMRLCGRLRIRPEDLEDWLAASRVSADEPRISVTTLRSRSPVPPPTGSFRDLMSRGEAGRGAA